MHTAFALVILAVASVNAIIEPTTPGPGDVFKSGEKCRFAWNADTESPTTWKETNVQLMTGDDLGMIHIDTVAQIDGTQSGVFEYDCPAVDPYSAIYFYQFSNPVNPEAKAWATRFTIASPTGEVVPPPQQVQPKSGKAIPWGVGKLVDPSKARPPPAYLAGSGSTNASTPPPGSPSTPGSGGASNAPSGDPSSPPPPASSNQPTTPSPASNPPSDPPTKPSAANPSGFSKVPSQSPSPSSSPRPSQDPQGNSAASLSVFGKSGVVAMSMIAGVFVLFL